MYVRVLRGFVRACVCLRLQVQQKGESDEVMVRCISGRLADAPGISYSHIASKAYDSGRTELAIKVGPLLHSTRRADR